MMRTVAVFALCAALATPAFAETLGEKTGVDSALGIAPTTTDFVNEATNSGMFEIESSKLAEERSDDPTKKFAAKMIADHTKIASAMKPLAEAAKVMPPTTLDSAHQSKLDKLKGLKGEDFTKQYHSDQVSAHESAVSLFKRYATGGKDTKMKAFAANTVATLEDHEKMAKDLDK